MAKRVLKLPASQRGHYERRKQGSGVRSIVFDSKLKGYTGHLVNEAITKASESMALPDPFKHVYSHTLTPQSVTVLKPMYDPQLLVTICMNSSALNQCVDAYKVNIESYGHVLEYNGPEGEEEAHIADRKLLQSFLSFPNGEMSLRGVRENLRVDLEKTGNNYLEVCRDRDDTIAQMGHLPSVTMRLCAMDTTPTTMTLRIPDPDGDGFIEKDIDRYFRRFVQIAPDGRRVYFKEFGDPRNIDPRTGLVDDGLEYEDTATEVYHTKIYIPGHAYGVPRWIGALPAILGSRESEMVNLNFFRENAIPAMAVLISGGMLTEDSFDKISSYINAAKGKDAMNRVLILEATADDSAGNVDQHPPAPKIEMKPMISERQQDGLFGDFDDRNTGKIRSVMRLPPIYTGKSEEYTKATAAASMRVAESQVFYPERTAFDEFMNRHVLPSFMVSTWKFKTVGPTSLDPDSLSRMLDAFHKTGALTPNIVIKIANSMLDVQIESIKEEWGDFPMQFIVRGLQQGNDIPGLEMFINPLQDLTADSRSNPSSQDDNLDGGDGVSDGEQVVNALREIVNDLRDASQMIAKART